MKKWISISWNLTSWSMPTFSFEFSFEQNISFEYFFIIINFFQKNGSWRNIYFCSTIKQKLISENSSFELVKFDRTADNSKWILKEFYLKNQLISGNVQQENM